MGGGDGGVGVRWQREGKTSPWGRGEREGGEGVKEEEKRKKASGKKVG